MEIGKQGSFQVNGRVSGATRRWLPGFLALVLLAAGGGVLRGQNRPVPPPVPQVAPEPLDPPEPPDPPDGEQVFVLNDGAVHLGVTLSDVTVEEAEALKLPAVAGVIVNSVQKGSAAARAGIETGDAIIEFDGIHVRSSAEMRRLIRETPAGRTVEMKIVRDGKTRLLSAKLEAYTHNYEYNIRVPGIQSPPINLSEIPFLPGVHRIALGVSGNDLSPQLAQCFGVNQGKGVLISEVTRGGAADRAGLKAGDVIVKLDGRSIGGVEDLRAALNDNFTDDTRKVSLTIVRDHHEQTVKAELTRSQGWESRTSNADASGPDKDLAQLPSQLMQLGRQATQLQDLASTQKALIQAEVQKQQQYLQDQWQRQVQQELRSLKEQLKQLPNLSAVLRRDGEI